MENIDYIIGRIESGPLYKHMERDYSIFFLSSIGDAHIQANVSKYANSSTTIGFMIFKNLVSMYYRLEDENEVMLKNIAGNILKNPRIKDEIFQNYSEAGEEMKRIY